MAEAIIRSLDTQEFTFWLHDCFIPGCDNTTRKRLKSSLSSVPAKINKKTKDGWEHAFRRDFWAVKSKNPNKSASTVIDALKDLEHEASKDLQSTVFPGQDTDLMQINPKRFWAAQVEYAAKSSAESTPLKRLLHRYDVFESLSTWGRQGRRFTALLIWFQVQRELEIAGDQDSLQMPGGDTDVAKAIRRIAAKHEVDSEVVQRRRYEANGWLRLVNHFGSGAILLPSKNSMYVC